MKKTMLSQKLKKEVKRKSLIALITLALIAAIVAVSKVSVNLIKTAKFSDGNSYEVTLSDVYDMKGKNATTANVKIVGGYNYFVSMDASGKVYGWGQNNNGQLAQGNTTNYSTPVYMGIDNATDIATGAYYTLVLKEDGTVWSAGYNGNGELGNGTTANKTNFVQVIKNDGEALDNIKAIAAGYNTSYAITNDGEVYTWGYNGKGQMGFGDTSSRTSATKTTLAGIKQISAGEHYTIALAEDGTVYVSGRNTEGQLGIGNDSTIYTWSKMKNINGTAQMENVKQVATGIYHTVVLTNDGNMYATGYNNVYQLADGSSSTKTKLQPMKSSDGSNMKNIKSIYAEGYNTFAITNENELYSVGYNNYGQLVQKTNSNLSVLTKTKTEQKTTAMAITRNPEYQTTAYIDEIGRVYTVGYSAEGELGNGTTDVAYAYRPYSISDYKILVEDSIVNLKKGETSNITPKISMGYNLMSQTFNYNLEYESLDTSVVTVNGKTITAVGIGTTYIRIKDDTNKIYGSVKVNVNETDGITYPKVAGGQNHQVALKSDGTVWTWGYNGYGQLGFGDKTTRTEPTKTNIENAIDVTAGSQYTAVLKADGTVWVSGYNEYGTTGDGTSSTKYNFIQVQGLTDVVAIESESNTMHALKSDGTVWSWGYNRYGQFGQNWTSTSAYGTPVKMRKVSNVMQISAGENFATMVAADGTVWGTGYNDYGQLGLSNTSTQTVPQQMLNPNGSNILTGIKEVSSDYIQTIVLTDDGRAYGVGYNGYGQLGDNTSTNRTLIVPMLNSEDKNQITNINHILTKGNATLVTTGDKQLYSTGYSNYGQTFAGNTTTTYMLTKRQTDKKIITMGMTRNTDYQTGTIIDELGRIYTIGYSGNGEIGHGTTETYTTQPWCITNSKITVDQNIVDLKVAGDTFKIKYKEEMGLNLLTNKFLGTDISFKSLDESIATVNNEGIITAVKTGTTYVKIIDNYNNLSKAIKVNVNGKDGKVQAKIVGGYNHFIGLKADGTLYGWGYNGYGQLGLGDKTSRTKPEEIKMPETENHSYPIDVVAGNQFTLVLKSDGTVWATGYNENGELGQNNGTTTTKFVQVKNEDGKGYLQNIVGIAASGNSSYAMTKEGEVYSWGYNRYGQLGVNDGTTRLLPVKMKYVKNIMQMSGQDIAVALLDSDGSVWTVGYNGNYGLGIGNDSNRSLPIKIKDTNGKTLYNVKEVASGRQHIVILKEDGSAWAVGYNGYGQLGDGTTTSKSIIVPMKISNEEKVQNIKHIYAAGDASALITEKGMYVTGNNDYGALFTKDATDRVYLSKVEEEKTILAGAFTKNYDGPQTGAIINDEGKVWTVGYNSNGEMANETVQNLRTPWLISKLKIDVSENNIINIENINETKQIKYKAKMGFNLLTDTIPTEKITFTSMDNNIATVAEDGTITAKSIGTTTIKLHDETNDIYARIKVNVNGQGNITQAKLDAGANHFVSLKGDGTVWGWGYNGYGQLGTENTSNQLKPVQAKEQIVSEDGTTKVQNVENAIDVAAGGHTTLILKADGTVWAAGRNEYGQVGNGNATTQKIFQKVKINANGEYLQDIIAVAMADSTSYALTKNGEVYAWGYNRYGQFGQNYGDTNAHYYPTKMQKVSNITQISAGYYDLMMLDADGSIWNVGYNDYSEFGLGNSSTYSLPQQMLDQTGRKILYNVKEIAAGGYHEIVLKEDNTVWSVGYNGYGQLGDSTTSTANIIKPVLDTNGKQVADAKHIHVGGHTTFISRNKNQEGKNQGIYVIGTNSYGNLFTKDTSSRSYATPVETDKDIIAMASTTNSDVYNTGVIADQDGMVYTVGYNSNGEIGNDTTQNLTTPWCISNKKINVEKDTINLKVKGEKAQINYTSNMEFNLLLKQVPNSICTFKSMDEKVATVDAKTGEVTAVATGTTFIKLYNKENNLYAAVKINVNGTQGKIQPKIVGGYNHFVSLKSDGTVWTWGSNGYGQLGTGNTVNSTQPVQLATQTIDDSNRVITTKITDAKDIATGYGHTLILKEDGTVWATGRNDYGQLGNGNTTNQKTLTQVKGPNGEGYLKDIIAITAGNLSSYALTKEGKVYSWGYNYYGSFGVGYTTSNNANYYPIQMKKVNNIIQMSAGENHIALLDANGSVWQVGYNGNYQLGTNNTSNYSLPQQMLDQTGTKILYGVKEISAGDQHTTILKEDGTVWSTGYNGYGQLMDGTTNSKAIIVQAKYSEGKAITNAKHIKSAGYSTFVSRKKDKDGENQGLYVAGMNNYGALFTKDTSYKTYATPVETDKDILTMALTRNYDDYNTGAIVDQDGKVYTVGYNANGEMANKTTQNLTTPWCISDLKIEVADNIINLENIDDTAKINYKLKMAFNLLTDDIPSGDCTFTSMDKDTVTVAEDGTITAKQIGTTFVKVYNKRNDLYAAVKVNVNGKGNKTQPKIEGGLNHFVALKADGTVWTWGHNGYGQLGTSDYVNKTEATKNTMKNVMDIAAGHGHTLILKTDGTVWATGRNDYGQLGDGTTIKSNSFHKVKLNNNGDYLENVVAIAAGNVSSYALTKDGTVYSWGYNYYGSFGVGYTTSNNANCYPIQMQKVNNIIQMSAGENHISLLDANGSVWQVGYNGNYQLGTNNTSNYSLPQQMLDQTGTKILYGVKEISAGEQHTTVLKEDGTVWSTGYNGYGQLMDGTTNSKSIIVQALDSNKNKITDLQDIMDMDN
ncbi:putative uncharacterized protein [Clostridium sp. CAG:470]|nr:putative uncharacterized protein [Clostridium sp. CAG:470]